MEDNETVIAHSKWERRKIQNFSRKKPNEIDKLTLERIIILKWHLGKVGLKQSGLI
jgi:hypothetical protein